MTFSSSTRPVRFLRVRRVALAALFLFMIAGLPLTSHAEWEMDPEGGVVLEHDLIWIYHDFYGNDWAFTCITDEEPSGPLGSFSCSVQNGGGSIEGEVVGITHQQVYSSYDLPEVDGHRIRFVRDLGRGTREIYEGAIGRDANSRLWMAGEFKREETRTVCAGRFCQVQTVTTGPMPFRGVTLTIAEAIGG